MPKTISIKLHNPDGTSVTVQVPADRASAAAAAAEEEAAE